MNYRSKGFLIECFFVGILFFTGKGHRWLYECLQKEIFYSLANLL